MIFIYYLLSLLIIHIIHTQTISESEAINKLIGDLLSRTERKNTDPIQFTWTNSFIDQTPIYNIMKDTAVDYENENDNSPSLKLLEILMKTSPNVEISRNVVRKIDKDIDRDQKDIIIRKANYLTEPFNHYKTYGTTPMSTKETDRDFYNVAKTMEAREMFGKPLDPEANYVITKEPRGDIQKRIFSGSIFDTTKIMDAETNIIAASSPSINSNINDNISAYSTPISISIPSIPTVTTRSFKEHDNNKYRKDIDENTHENDDSKEINSAKKLSVVKALEDLIKNIPNYNNEHENKIKYNDLQNGIFPSKKYKSNVTNSMQASTLFQILGYDKNISEDKYKDIMVTSAAKASMPTTSNIETHDLDFESVTDINDWNTNLDSVPNMSLRLVTGIDNTDYISSTDLHLLGDGMIKDFKGHFTIKSDVTEPTKAKASKLKNLFRFHKAKDKHNSYKKRKDVSENKDLIQLYNLLSTMGKTPKPKGETNWEKVKKFLGHDRVCNCKCRANRTICKVCAATDRVMRELTFEFNNLAKYMSDHCMEIQTFFWMNPSGGKKLRDSVHRIDKSLNNYYKRIRGKCTGQTCKTFATYLDKRHLELLKKT